MEPPSYSPPHSSASKSTSQSRDTNSDGPIDMNGTADHSHDLHVWLAPPSSLTLTLSCTFAGLHVSARRRAKVPAVIPWFLSHRSDVLMGAAS